MQEYLDVNFLKRALENEDSMAPRKRDMELVLVRADAGAPDELPTLVGEIVSLGVAHDGSVEAIVSNLVVISFGAFPESEPPDGRERLVASLRAKFGNRVAVVHGKRSCLFGPFGSELRRQIGSQIPDFMDIMRRLADMPSGEAQEV